jgi:hypothetical protein
MGLTLAFHSVSTGPSKGRGVNLCHFVARSGNGQGKHGVSKHGVSESILPQHPVIGWETTGDGQVNSSTPIPIKVRAGMKKNIV